VVVDQERLLYNWLTVNVEPSFMLCCSSSVVNNAGIKATIFNLNTADVHVANNLTMDGDVLTNKESVTAKKMVIFFTKSRRLFLKNSFGVDFFCPIPTQHDICINGIYNVKADMFWIEERYFNLRVYIVSLNLKWFKSNLQKDVIIE